ncbi:MAG: tRNA 2-thiouridine(34) synthase MnmA [Pseudomonadota bacterium]|nr:MAG: tRNA 2-thiouridine(34) synthase MnmA [Pseudomonadota bacterium]
MNTSANDIQSEGANAERVIVGLSGGVDSSVAALLLRDQGYAVQGLFMKNWEGDDREDHCAAEADYRDASRVCERLGIELFGVNFADEYWERVFRYFIAAYEAGYTPNPDVLCNKEIKFRAFLDHALRLGAEYIATGHYARIARHDDHHYLLKARDNAKDQSYFLYTLGQEQLARTLFPLGEIDKSQVRRIAQRAGLVTHDKKDSTGICFIGERNFREFLARYLPARPGDIRSVDGECIGEHAGLMYYTLGQRQGLGIGGRRGHSEGAWYVVAKDMEANTLVVAQQRDHALLQSRWLDAVELHWVADPPAKLPLRCHAKTRYRQADVPATIVSMSAERCRVTFDTAQWAVAPGQSVVFYQGERCLGGALIDATERTPATHGRSIADLRAAHTDAPSCAPDTGEARGC